VYGASGKLVVTLARGQDNSPSAASIQRRDFGKTDSFFQEEERLRVDLHQIVIDVRGVFARASSLLKFMPSPNE
jgi:hypothetical protein